MARLALRLKAKTPRKHRVQMHYRCELCGRSRGYYRKFRCCRCCFRKLASEGMIPGVRKASW